jgi:hypothetical protein
MPRKTAKPDALVSSEDGVRAALARREEIAAALETLRARLAKTKLATQVSELEVEDARWDAAIREFVLGNYKAGRGYEDDSVKITKVVGHRRTWNAEKLKKLVKPGVFKNLVSLTVRPEKIDEYVKAGRLSLDEVADAFDEVPNAPYAKFTFKNQDDRSSEAESLAAKLA